MSLFGGLFGGSNNTKTRALDRAAQQQGQYATEDRNRFLEALSGGQEALNTSARAAMDSAMPQFQQQLQSTRESAIRRGISTGDLGTSYEGDLASAFQRNMANSIAGQATSLWNTQVGGYGQLANGSTNNYLDLLSGNADRATAAQNASMNFWGSLAGPAGSIFGHR